MLQWLVDRSEHHIGAIGRKRPKADGWDFCAHIEDCRTGSALACSSRDDVAVFVGKECHARFLKLLKRLKSCFSLRRYAAVQDYYAAVIAA